MLDGEKVLIKGFLGTGASCLAYDAVRIEVLRKIDGTQTEIRHRVVLKEFYPEKRLCGTQLLRLPTGELRKESDSETDNLFNLCQERFLVSYYRSAYLGGNEKTASFVSIPFKCISANGTYYLMYAYDPGKTAAVKFDDNLSVDYSLYDLFSLLYDTAESVARLHDYDEEMQAHGSLHLDLSPENLLLQGDGKVKLFDMDSFIPVNQVRNRQYQVSCPNGYMAPEQVSPWRTRIGPWTDVFALGAIAYRYLMHKKLDYAWLDAGGRYQMDGSRARAFLEEFCYEEELETKVRALSKQFSNQGISLLKQFLRSTLAYDYRKRCQNMKDAQFMLKELMQLASQTVPPIAEHFQENQVPVFGQERVLKELEVLFETRRFNMPVFISGVGGIGKSTLAKEFAAKHRESYQAIVEVHANRFEQVLMQVNFEDEEDTEAAEYLTAPRQYLLQKAEKIRAFCEAKKMLLIIHDYDQRNLEYLEILLKTKADILITSRCMWSDLGYPQLTLKEDILSPKHSESAARDLFLYHYRTELNENEKTDLDELLAYVDYHPLTITLLAKQMAFYEGEEKRLKEMLERLKKEGINAQTGETLLHGKDGGDYTENSTQGHLKQIFTAAISYQALQKEELDALGILLLFGKNAVTRQEFTEWSGLIESDGAVLERLRKQGWICKNHNTYRILYPIAEVLGSLPELRLNQTKCLNFINTFYDKQLKDASSLSEREFLLNIGYALWKRVSLQNGYDDFYCNLLEEIASMMTEGGWLDEAMEVTEILAQKAESNQTRVRGEIRLGAIFYEKEAYEQALIHQEKAKQLLAAIQEKDLEEEQATVLDWLGKTYLKLGKEAEAKECFETEKQIWTVSLSEEKAKIPTRFYDAAARCSVFLGEYEQALDYYYKALKIREESTEFSYEFPEINPLSPLSAKDKVLEFGRRLSESFLEEACEEPDRMIAEYNMISCLEWKLGHEKAAFNYANKGLELQQDYLGEDHLYVAYSYRWMAQMYREMSKRKQEIWYESEALKILERVLGTEHEETKACKQCLEVSKENRVRTLQKVAKRSVSKLKNRCRIPSFIAVPLFSLFIFSCILWYVSLITRQDFATIWWEFELQRYQYRVTPHLLGVILMVVTSMISKEFWEKWLSDWYAVGVIVVIVFFWLKLNIGVGSFCLLFVCEIYGEVFRKVKKRVFEIVFCMLRLAALYLIIGCFLGISEAIAVCFAQLISELKICKKNKDYRYWTPIAIGVTVLFAVGLIIQGAALFQYLFVAAMYGWLLYGESKLVKQASVPESSRLLRMLFFYQLCQLLAAVIQYDVSQLLFIGILGTSDISAWFVLGILCSFYKVRKWENPVDILREADRIEKRREAMYRYRKLL